MANRLWLALLAPLLTAACGDPEMALWLMDAPPPGVTSVRLHVASMTVHVIDKSQGKKDEADGVDGEKWRRLRVDRAIDLVQYQGERAATLLGTLSLPLGKVTQIRLHLDLARENAVTKDGADCALDTSLVPEEGVKISHPFKAFATAKGGKHDVIVDFALDESLLAEGGCYRLQPVIKLHKVSRDGEVVDTAGE